MEVIHFPDAPVDTLIYSLQAISESNWTEVLDYPANIFLSLGGSGFYLTMWRWDGGI